MPVRTIPIGSRSLTGRVAGTKQLGEAAFESTLERDLLLVLEFAPTVAAYEVQPVRIAYTDAAGRARAYTPDVLLHRYRLGGRVLPPLLVEVKYRSDAKPAERAARRALAEKLRAARRYACDLGWHFCLLTERDIRATYLHTARFLLPFRHHAAREERLARILAHVRAVGAERVEGVLAAVALGPARDASSDYNWCVPALWRLLAAGELLTDYAAPLTMQSTVYDPAVLRPARVTALRAEPAWLGSRRPRRAG